MKLTVKLNKVKNTGFTIIEVLIVLAIVGVILVIVFLAVPQLNRAERNRQKKFDASQIASWTRECLIRSNMDLAKCDTMAEVGIDTSKLHGITDVVYCGSGGSGADTRCTDSYAHPSGAYPVVPALQNYTNNTLWSSSVDMPFMIVSYRKQCQSNITNPTKTVVGKDDLVVLLMIEGSRYPETICYAT